VREAGQAALYLKLEPQFGDAAQAVELPEIEAMAARWQRYLEDQDLTGLDRDHIRRLGVEYIDRAVESAG